MSDSVKLLEIRYNLCEHFRYRLIGINAYTICKPHHAEVLDCSTWGGDKCLYGELIPSLGYCVAFSQRSLIHAFHVLIMDLHTSYSIRSMIIKCVWLLQMHQFQPIYTYRQLLLWHLYGGYYHDLVNRKWNIELSDGTTMNNRNLWWTQRF